MQKIAVAPTRLGAKIARPSEAKNAFGRAMLSAGLTASLLVTVSVGRVEAQPTNVVIPNGYTITQVNTDTNVFLNAPTAMTFYGDTIWVTEVAGTVKQIDNMGNVTTMLTAAQLAATYGTGTLVSPLTGIVFARDWFWLVHRQTNSNNAPGVPFRDSRRAIRSGPFKP
jgi:hypothetical protein